MIKARTLQDLFKRYRRPGDLVFAAAFFAFSLFLLATVDGQVTWGRGKVLAQPAVVPWIAVIAMVLFSGLHLISSLMSPKIEGRWAEVGFWLRGLEFVAWFMAYVWLVPRLGYLPATVIFATVLTWRLGYRHPRMLLAAAAFGMAVVLLFKTFLQVKVPGGALYDLLPGALRTFMLTYF